MAKQNRDGNTCGPMKVKKTVVCLLLWMAIHQINSSHVSYVPEEMKKTIQSIQQYYRVSNGVLYNNQLVVPRKVLTSNNTERKMVYMVGVLEIYEELIGKMLKALPTPSPPTTGSRQNPTSSSESSSDIRQKLTFILDKVQALKRAYFKDQENLLHELQDLKKIKVDNVNIQVKALVEFLQLYQKASELPEDIKQRRRRRRQTKSKIHQRG